MTKQEALVNLEVIREHIENPTSEIRTGIAITSLTAGIEALEKQIPKKMDMYSEGHTGDLIYKCPTCGEAYNRFYECKPYCMFCGQRLDWSDKE